MSREPYDDRTLTGAVPGYVLVQVLRADVPEGALCRVYECRAERTGELVILKVLTRGLERAVVQRVLRESRVIAGIRASPHVARVYDVGEAPGAGPYVAFEKLKGRSFSALLATQGRLPVAEALSAVRDAARALEAAAGVGVAHRDIKPANIYRLDDGTVKVTDFGLAAPLLRMGGPPGIYGTPAFLAPELLRGAPADVRTDIYALGATLFELVTARPLFEGSTSDVLAAHQKKPVPSIATMVPNAGIAVVDVIYRLLHKDPLKRPQSARDVVSLLEEAMGKKRTSSSAAMKGVGAPAPSEPAWPTSAWPGAAATQSGLQPLPPPPRTGTPAPSASPFDAPSDPDGAYLAQPTGVLGTLKQLGVTEIVQMLEIGKKSARVDVTIEGETGTIHVHDGQLVFASMGAQQGERAVIFLCRKKEGFFRIHYEKEPTAKNISKPTQFILLEAMREIDEQNAPAAAAAALAAPPDSGSSWPVERSKSSSAPRQQGRAMGDGIQFDDKNSERRLTDLHDPTLETAGEGSGSVPRPRIDDPTLPEATLRRPAPLAARFTPQLIELWARLSSTAARLWRRLEDKLEKPLRTRMRRIHPKLDTVPPVVVAAGALVVAVLLLTTLVRLVVGAGSSLSYDDALEMVVEGRAGDVIDELEAVDAADRTFDQDLVLGHAWAARDEAERALELYRSAVPAGHADDIALSVLLGRLDASAPDDEIDLLVLWPDDDAEAALAELTLDPRPYVRAASVAILVERGRIAPIDVEATALIDFIQSQTCAGKRVALAALRGAGKSYTALEILDKYGRLAEGCFGTNELRNTFSAVKRRVIGEP